MHIILYLQFVLSRPIDTVNQSSFIIRMTERRPAMHKSNTHSNSSKVVPNVCLYNALV